MGVSNIPRRVIAYTYASTFIHRFVLALLTRDLHRKVCFW